jgi:hypothetical protein
MKSNFEAWWPVIKVIGDLLFFLVTLVFMIMAMAAGRWDEAIFWLLLRTAGTLQDIKDKL